MFAPESRQSNILRALVAGSVASERAWRRLAHTTLSRGTTIHRSRSSRGGQGAITRDEPEQM